MKFSKITDYLLYIVICIACVLVMLPRILSAQFGLLDDGVLLLVAQTSLKNLASNLYGYQAAGRFLPTALFLRGVGFSFAELTP